MRERDSSSGNARPHRNGYHTDRGLESRQCYTYLQGSVLAVFLTNLALNQRQLKELDHDRDQKNREREMSLRKEVFHEASEAVWASLIAVSRFSDLEIPHDKVTVGYLDKSPTIAKVHVIAKDETVKAVINFSGELNSTFYRLTAKRIPLIWKKEQLELHKNEADHDQRALAFYQEHLNFVEECLEEGKRLGRFVMPVVCSVRNELEMPIDAEEYEKSLEAGSDQALDAFKKFREQLGA